MSEVNTRVSRGEWFADTRFGPSHIQALHAMFVGQIANHLGSGKFISGIWGEEQSIEPHTEQDFLVEINGPHSHSWASWAHGEWKFRIDNYIDTGSAHVSISGPDAGRLNEISIPVFDSARFMSRSEAAV